jgi:hypothetical protein
MQVHNLFVDDLTSVTPADLQRAIVQLAKSGVEEKFRLDFKQKWDAENQCPDVAALANSYGGLLVIGATDDRQHFPGTIAPKNSDLKTQISSQIATRISPVPQFEVHTCPAPDDRNNLLAVIRVSPQPQIHMYLKGDKPVYVRNEDGTMPARAPQLQALLDRVRTAETAGSSRTDALAAVARDWFVTKAKNPTDRNANKQARDNRVRSETVLMIGIMPERPIGLTLDVTLEDRFKELIHEIYPSLRQRASVDLGTLVVEGEDRAGSWFRFHHLDVDRNHEIIWALNSDGLIQCTCEVADRLAGVDEDLWSITDLFVSLNSTLRLAHDFWTSVAFFGSGQLAARLRVSKLTTFANNGEYPSLFYGTFTAIPQIAARPTYGNYPVSQAGTQISISYDDRASRRRTTLVSFGNQLLRDLRFSVDTKMVRSALDTFSWVLDQYGNSHPLE